ncbi:MAG: twin-arginine translocase TatA/TatE family subunit [Armatimonadetes bacterium]|nr:twin-arginine translocase TatA/TatE family subunit [Armatimonadota bacterium]
MPVLAYMGTQEWIILLVIVMVLFGASRLPMLARSIGESLGEFRKATRDSIEDEKKE